MIIRKLKLKNFGVHKNLDIDTKGKRIIGLLGKNGSGKSTILSAIKYAFTSEISGTIESNLRSGSKTGSVELEFLYNNETGTIKRTIGKSSKAELIWKGTRITVKKEIENTLLDVLGVDKKSLSSAVFLSQGSLNNLLFGSDADREELFIKVMNMSFCQKFAEILDQKSKSILDGNDNITLIDELNRQRIMLSERLDNYKQDLNKYPECGEEIASLEERSRLTAKLAENIGIINQLELNINKYQGEIKKLGVNDINEELIRKVGQDAKKLKESYDKIDMHLERLRNIEITENHLENHKEEIRQDELNIKSLEKELKILQEVMDKEKLKEKIAYHSGIVEVYDSWLSTYDDALSNEESLVDCMTCGTEHKVSMEGREKIQRKLINAQKQLSEHTYKNDELLKDINDMEKIVSDKQSNIIILNKSVINSEESIKHNKSKLEKDLGSNLEELEKQLLATGEESHKIDERHLKLCADWGQMSGIKAKLEHTSDRVMSIKYENEEVKEKIENLQRSNRNVDDLREIDKTHKELRAKLDELSTQYTDVNNRYNDLMIQNEEVELKKDVHKELQRLKEVFSRKGLPKAFVDSRFEILTELTQRNLEELGTDFYITQSESKSLAFDYNINYEGDLIQLPMHKLSGGQRVRLSLAFILAVQQLIVSDLGFVTLDEPSTHLDEEGVDSLCNLLEKVRDVFADSEHQLWVCDHNPKLESAFDTIVKL